MEKTAPFTPPTKVEILAALKTPPTEKCGVHDRAFDALEGLPCHCPIAAPKRGEWLQDHKEIPQSFAKYIAGKNTSKVTAMRNKIYIMPLEASVTDSFLELLCKFSNIFYPGVMATTMKAMSLDDPKFQSKVTSRVNEWVGKKQYLTKDILNLMAPLLPQDALNLMGCLNTDLFPNENWNYVFGWGRSDIKCGVFSFARFSETFFDPDAKEDPQLLEYKALRIMVHEMGHTFNIGHCTFHNCGMNGMNHAEELMAKPIEFCPVCLKKLQYCLGFDPIKRFEGLRAFCLESKNPHVTKLAQYYESALAVLAQQSKPTPLTQAPKMTASSTPMQKAALPKPQPSTKPQITPKPLVTQATKVQLKPAVATLGKVTSPTLKK